MPRRWATIVFAIMLLSMWTNLLARTYAWMVLLQRTGVINKTLMGLGLIDRAAAAGQQPDRRHHRHDLHHAALRHPAAARHHPRHRSGHPPGGRRSAAPPAGRRSDRVPPSAGPARHRCRRADGLRHVARLLRDAGAARRHRQHDAGRTDRPVRPVARQLGHGRCRGLRAAGRHARRSTPCSCGSSAAAPAWEGAEMLLEFRPPRRPGNGCSSASPSWSACSSCCRSSSSSPSPSAPRSG